MEKRDCGLDIAKGILIILMIIGHMNISKELRAVIYSFHMAGFVFYSGYCFKPSSGEKLWKYIKSLSKAFLLPYAIWAVFYLIMNDRSLCSKVLDIICGMSKSNNIFSERATVGQVYFLLLLFLIRLMYVCLYKYVKNKYLLSGIVLLLSLIGVSLGRSGMWLPWSIDSALFMSIFYHAGYLVKKYDFFEILHQRKSYYFLLVVAWMASIYQGGMSLFVRNYGNCLVTVLGAISASIILYDICSFLTLHIHPAITKLFMDIGRNTLSILLVHTIFGGYIVIIILNSLMKTERIDSLNIIYLIVLVVQILFGLIWGRVYEKIIKALL